jgi:FixJ family two-component response regulator
VAAVHGNSGLDDDLLGSLSPRQREILQLIVEGKSTKEIAFAISVSVTLRGEEHARERGPARSSLTPRCAWWARSL